MLIAIGAMVVASAVARGASSAGAQGIPWRTEARHPGNQATSLSDLQDKRLFVPHVSVPGRFGLWRTAARPELIRMSHTASLLTDGRVLVAGGQDTIPNPDASFPPTISRMLASAEMYDPATDSWHPTGGMTEPRIEHVSVVLDDGSVLALGGYVEGQDGSTPAVSRVERYDPSTGSWRRAADMRSRRPYGTSATLLPNGDVLVVGHIKGEPTSAETYDPGKDMWRDAPGLEPPRFHHSATRLCSGDVLVAGGNADGELTASAWIYESVTAAWRPTAPLPARSSDLESVLLGDCTVLVVSPVGALRYDPAAEQWTRVPYSGRRHLWGAFAPLSDGGALWVAGDAYIGPGPFDSGPIPDVHRFDVTVGRWEVAADVEPRVFHTATLLRDGRVLVAGGSGERPPQLFSPSFSTVRTRSEESDSP